MTSSSDAAIDTMIRDFFKAWDRRDADHIVSCFTDDGIYHNTGMAPIVGKAAIRQVLSQDPFPWPRIEIHHPVVNGGVVMNERTDYMTFGDRDVVLPVCGVFEIQDGHIKAWREYFDSAPFGAN
jgi:limonene-1,2-epoxide hydrolase